MAKNELTYLVVKAQSGDKTALNDLLSSCYRDLYYCAYKAVQNEDLAADITQESCLEIISTLQNLRHGDAFGVWARRIVYHQAARHFRQTREITPEEDEDGLTILDRLPDEDPGSLPEQVVEDQEFRKTMQDMLDALPPQQRTALMLYYYEHLSVGEIAHIQGVSEGTVKSRLNYGRKAVKTQVEAYEQKTGVRLHSLAPLPLLLLLLLDADRKASVAKAASALSGIGAGIGAAATTATATTATAAGMGIGIKIAAGLVAVAAAVGITIGGIALAKKDNTDTPETTDPIHSIAAETPAGPTSATESATDPTVFEDEILGQWVSLTGSGREVSFRDDHTVILDGVTYRFRKDVYYEEEDDELTTEYHLYAQDANSTLYPYHFEIRHYDGYSVLDLHAFDPNLYGDIYPYGYSADIFYRPADFPDYEPVLLTTENYRNYIYFEHRVYHGPEGKDHEPVVLAEFTVNFYDWVAPVSYCRGQLPKDARCYQIAYDLNTGECTWLSPFDDNEPTNYWGGLFAFHAAGVYSYESWTEIGNATDVVTGYLWLYEPREAYDVSGLVLVPKS